MRPKLMNMAARKRIHSVLVMMSLVSGGRNTDTSIQFKIKMELKRRMNPSLGQCKEKIVNALARFHFAVARETVLGQDDVPKIGGNFVNPINRLKHFR